MGNNEDKRQLTPITEAIERFEKGRILFQESLDRMRNAKASRTKDYYVMEGRLQNIITSIEFLKSLLPKEEQSHIDFAAAYKTAVHYDPMIKSPRTVYYETFKPYEK